jgi:hypothetical protein
MNRSTPLRRTRPLEARTGLRASTGLARSPASALKPATAQRKAPRDTGPTARVRALVLERDGYACACCGVSVIGKHYSLQHRKRRSQGGRSDAPNLLTVLGDGTTGCHARIDSRVDPHDEAKGYTVRSHDDPALIPVMYFSEGGSGFAAWLCADGSLSFDGPEEGAA